MSIVENIGVNTECNKNGKLSSDMMISEGLFSALCSKLKSACNRWTFQFTQDLKVQIHDILLKKKLHTTLIDAKAVKCYTYLFDHRLIANFTIRAMKIIELEVLTKRQQNHL